MYAENSGNRLILFFRLIQCAKRRIKPASEPLAFFIYRYRRKIAFRLIIFYIVAYVLIFTNLVAQL